MNKMIIVLTAALTVCGLFAQAPAEKNLLPNGNFEKVRKFPRASSAYYMGITGPKGNWDLGKGPIIKMISGGWTPNNATKIKLRIITVGPNGENKDLVAEGKNSIHMSGKWFHMYHARKFPTGTYKISLKYKGKGNVGIAFYGERKDKGVMRHVMSIEPVSLKAKPQWQTFEKTMVLGKWNPKKEVTHCTFVLTGRDLDAYIDDIKVIRVDDPLAKGKM